MIFRDPTQLLIGTNLRRNELLELYTAQIFPLLQAQFHQPINMYKEITQVSGPMLY
jgi:hypothetical protein